MKKQHSDVFLLPYVDTKMDTMFASDAYVTYEYNIVEMSASQGTKCTIKLLRLTSFLSVFLSRK